MQAKGPKHYNSLEEFEREEIRPGKRCGWSLDDLYSEASFNPAKEDLFEEGAKELDFDF